MSLWVQRSKETRKGCRGELRTDTGWEQGDGFCALCYSGWVIGSTWLSAMASDVAARRNERQQRPPKATEEATAEVSLK